MEQKKNHFKTAVTILVVVLAIAALAVVFVLRAQQNRPQAAGESAILVQVQSPASGSLTSTANFAGKLQPASLVNVFPKGVGEVAAVYVQPGDAVQKGDLLFELDPAAAQLSYDTALAGYNSALAQAQQMMGSTLKGQQYSADAAEDQASDSLDAARTAADQAERALKTAAEQRAAAKTAFEQQPTIGSSGYDAIAYQTAKEKYEDAEKAYQQAAAAYTSADSAVDRARMYYQNARNSYHLATNDVPEELKAIADATVKQAAAGLASAEYQLSNTKVYAPIDGVVESVNVSQHNSVSSQAPACVISNKTVMNVECSLPAGVAATLAVGDAITVQYGGESSLAVISEIATAPAQSGLYDVKAVLQDGSFSRLSGVNAKLTVPTGREDNALILPVSCLYYEDNRPYVYLLQEGRAVKTYLETSVSNSVEIAVISGLDAASQVISTWHPSLTDGAEVTAVYEGE